MTTIAQATRDLDRAKVYLNTLDEQFEQISRVVPTVTIGRGLGVLQASMVGLAQYSLPSELADLPAEAARRLSVLTDSIRSVEERVAVLRSCLAHIRTGAPLNDSSSAFCMAARVVRMGSLNGEAAEAAALVKTIEENLILAEKKVAVLKEKRFRVSNACEIALLKNSIRFYSSLLTLSRKTPSSVLDEEQLEAAIARDNKALDELHVRLNRYYARTGAPE